MLRNNRTQPVDPLALLKAFCAVLPGGGPDIQLNGSTIHWSFTGDVCPCPVGRAIGDPIICLCGIQHVRGMLEPLLGTGLQVSLLKSRLRGDESCVYAITLPEADQKSAV